MTGGFSWAGKLYVANSIDLMREPLGPKEGFLISLVDGTTSAEELVLISGMEPSDARTMIEELVRRGILVSQPGGGAVRPPSRPPSMPSEQGFDERTMGGEDELEIPPVERKAIDELHARLERDNYFELLGISTAASPADVKRAFVGLSRRFHPDRYFRKTLGPYRERLDRVFAKIREAYDLLSDFESRREYAMSIGATEPASAPSPPSAGGAEPPKVTSPPAAAPGPPVGAARPPEKPRAQKAREFYDAGTVDFLAKKYLSAQAHFRLAVAYAPRDAEYRKRLEEVERILRTEEVKKMVQKAEYAEATGRREEAIRHLREAIHLGTQDPQVFFLLGRLLLLEQVDLQFPRRCLLKALELEPNNAEYHRWMGQLYVQAGMIRNALRELERAVELDPGDEQARKDLQALRRSHA